MAGFFLVSLGCSKNLVDSEFIAGGLLAEGWQWCNSEKDADMVIINTCGFIQPAVEEAIDEILDCAGRIGERTRLVVTGCLVQRYRDQLLEVLPEVDLFLGTEVINNFSSLVAGALDKGEKLVLSERPLPSPGTTRSLSTPTHRSWLKITEGCNNRCSYCLIPAIRGPLRSRKIDELVAEASKLEDAGVVELGIIAQDITSYGKDFNRKGQLEALLSSIMERTTIPWVRLLYLYPSTISQELIEMIRQNDRIIPYLDIPLQHVSARILKRMNRHYDKKYLYDLIENLRKKIPEISLRTTFLVGFPGETDSDMAELEEFMREIEFDHVGVFPYCNEEGCPSEFFEDQCSEEIKKQRVERLFSIQQDISAKKLKRFLGRKLDVLVEGLSSETDLLLEGRTKFQAPEVDGCVYINEGTAEQGTIVKVEITESQIYDLVGKVVQEN